MEVVYVSYAQAQKLIPVFKHIVKVGPYREVRESARRILSELELVRGDISYDPLEGRQVILRAEKDREFLQDALTVIEE